MECPYCGGSTRVIDSRPIHEGIRRRRQCLECEHRFTTHERLAPVELKVLKADGEVEDFQPEKLLRTVRRVTRDDDVSDERMRRAVRRVELQLQDLGRPAIHSWELAMLLLDQLRGLDPLAHHRLRANYTDAEGRPLPRPGSAAAVEAVETEAVHQIGLFDGGDDAAN
jgi:transcriptional repressor NrdR